jgi:hypothetical protein
VHGKEHDDCRGCRDGGSLWRDVERRKATYTLMYCLLRTGSSDMVMYVSMLRVWWYDMRQSYEMEKRSDEKMINHHHLKARIYTYPLSLQCSLITPINTVHSLDLTLPSFVSDQQRGNEGVG